MNYGSRIRAISLRVLDQFTAKMAMRGRRRPQVSQQYLRLNGDLEVFCWSVAGLETSVVVRKDDMKIAFDMGYSPRPAVGCHHVFISHGHIDHIGGISTHVRKRLMSRLKQSTYYMPEHLIQTTRQTLEIAATQSETKEIATHANLKAVKPGDFIQLPSDYIAVPFQTVHAVTSQGYIIYKQLKRLKEEFQGMEPQKIATLKKQGIQILDERLVPEIAFTGDTTFEIFEQLAHPDLLKVKLLIMETTYIDKDVDKHGKTSKTKARERGHTHFQELLDNADLFKDVGSIYLMHFSDKYSSGYIWKTIKKANLPAPLQGKLYVGNMVHDFGL